MRIFKVIFENDNFDIEADYYHLLEMAPGDDKILTFFVSESLELTQLPQAEKTTEVGRFFCDENTKLLAVFAVRK